ncbi:helix-turn-helix domain-containing protein [Shewanella algae]
MALFMNGVSKKHIAEQAGISLSSVYRIIRDNI